MKAIGALAIIAISGIFCHCCAEEMLSSAPNTPSTATEVFHLRSECAGLGRKVLDDNIVGSALYQSQVSHYDSKSNRCYVLLVAETTDLTKRPHQIHSYLYDGQTGALLASLHYDGEYHKSGLVFDPRHEPTSVDNGFYDDTKAYIDALMDEGKR